MDLVFLRSILIRLGEPFYTTKKDGNGLGLMVTKQIIKEHRGQIDIISNPGNGTMLKIILPIEKYELGNEFFLYDK